MRTGISRGGTVRCVALGRLQRPDVSVKESGRNENDHVCTNPYIAWSFLTVIIEQHAAVGACDIRSREVLSRILVSDDGFVDVFHRV